MEQISAAVPVPLQTPWRPPGDGFLALAGILDPQDEQQMEESNDETEWVQPPACFLDTNVLVYAVSQRAPLHEKALEEIRRRYGSKQELWISRQVLREYLVTLTRPQTFSSPQPARELLGDIRYFQSRFQVADEGPAVTAKLLDLIEQTDIGGKQIHDANIVATMLVHGVTTLLTNNPGDFARYSEVIQIIPLEEL